MISQKTIQNIIDTARIEEVVGDFVTLKRTGVNMKGLCPFHHEKTPSFTVTPSKNIFMCFGCGKGGDSIAFLRELEGHSYPEALQYLAKKYNIVIEETENKAEQLYEKQLNDSLYILNDFAVKYYYNQLTETDLGKSVGLSYFKQRGFRDETIKKFGLGFANPTGGFGENALKNGYTKEILEKSSLISDKGNDFFRNRVIFPIHALSGKVAAFAGRTLSKELKGPKYINSTETEVYNKSKTLYGMYFAKKDIRKFDECVIVEGYTDVISLHQAGIENVVASSGTALTVEQIQMIKRFTENIKIIYDGDAAGIKAALRGLDMILEQNMNVKIVLLPDGNDPDSYLQKVGASAFEAYVKDQAKDFILFKIKLLLDEAQNDPIKRASLSANIIESIAKIPNPIKRSEYIKNCVELMDIEENIIVYELNKAIARNLDAKKETIRKDLNKDDDATTVDSMPKNLFIHGKNTQVASNLKSFSTEERLAYIIIKHGTDLIDKNDDYTVGQYIFENIHDMLPFFENTKAIKIINAAIHYYNEHGEMADFSFYASNNDEEIASMSIKIVASEYTYSKGWEERHDMPLRTQKLPEENIINEMVKVINRRKLNHVMKLCNDNQKRMKVLKPENDDDYIEIMHILDVHTKLLSLKGEISAMLNIVVLE